MPHQIAFLTTQKYLHVETGDEPAIEALRARGHLVDLVAWRDPAIQWDQYDLVVIRSTWDYHHHLPAFLDVLAEIDRQTTLLNPLSLVRWNVDKNYLFDLVVRGFPVAPTLMGEGLTLDGFSSLFRELATDDLILKPVVSASAIDTYRLAPADPRLPEIARKFKERAWLAQPFLPQVIHEGEFSLLFFNGKFSHAALKTPATDDFRVQEEYGGQTNPVEPPVPLLRLAEKILASLDLVPLYARVDLVQANDQPVLMEVELVEPSLYLMADPAAGAHFVAAVEDVLS